MVVGKIAGGACAIAAARTKGYIYDKNKNMRIDKSRRSGIPK